MDKLSIPEGMEVVQQGDAFVFRRSWRYGNPGAYFLPVFAVFWLGMLGVFYYQMLTSRHPPGAVLLFPLIHVGVGVFLGYFAVATLINKTDITVDGSQVSVTSGPVRWVGDKIVPGSEIHGLVVRERRGNRGGATYLLMYVDGDNRERKLTPSMPHREQADFLAQSIERLLGIGESA